MSSHSPAQGAQRDNEASNSNRVVTGGAPHGDDDDDDGLGLDLLDNLPLDLADWGGVSPTARASSYYIPLPPGSHQQHNSNTSSDQQLLLLDPLFSPPYCDDVLEELFGAGAISDPSAAASSNSNMTPRPRRGPGAPCTPRVPSTTTTEQRTAAGGGSSDSNNCSDRKGSPLMRFSPTCFFSDNEEDDETASLAATRLSASLYCYDGAMSTTSTTTATTMPVHDRLIDPKQEGPDVVAGGDGKQEQGQREQKVRRRQGRRNQSSGSKSNRKGNKIKDRGSGVKLRPTTGTKVGGCAQSDGSRSGGATRRRSVRQPRQWRRHEDQEPAAVFIKPPPQARPSSSFTPLAPRGAPSPPVCLGSPSPEVLLQKVELPLLVRVMVVLDEREAEDERACRETAKRLQEASKPLRHLVAFVFDVFRQPLRAIEAISQTDYHVSLISSSDTTSAVSAPRQPLPHQRLAELLHKLRPQIYLIDLHFTQQPPPSVATPPPAPFHGKLPCCSPMLTNQSLCHELISSLPHIWHRFVKPIRPPPAAMLPPRQPQRSPWPTASVVPIGFIPNWPPTKPHGPRSSPFPPPLRLLAPLAPMPTEQPPLQPQQQPQQLQVPCLPANTPVAVQQQGVLDYVMAGRRCGAPAPSIALSTAASSSSSSSAHGSLQKQAAQSAMCR